MCLVGPASLNGLRQNLPVLCAGAILPGANQKDFRNSGNTRTARCIKDILNWQYFPAAMTISCSPGGHFFGVVKLVSAITPLFLYLRTLDALNEWRSGEGGFRELLIEKYTPIVDALGGVAAGVVISSVMHLL